MEDESNRINKILADFTKHHDFIKGKLDEYKYSYYKQLLFVSATMLGILIALNPKDEHLSIVGIYSILLSQVLLALTCLSILLLLRAEVNILRKFRKDIVHHYQKKLKTPSHYPTALKADEPFFFFVLEWIATYSFFTSIVALLVFVFYLTIARLH